MAKQMMEVTESSGNVFADIGMPEPEVALLKSRLVEEIADAIEAKGMTQTEAGRVMGLAQANLSRLLRNQVQGFSLERMMMFLVRLGRGVDVAVASSRARGGAHLRFIAHAQRSATARRVGVRKGAR